MVDIQSTAAEIRQGKKRRRKKKPQGKNIMVCHITYGNHINNNTNLICIVPECQRLQRRWDTERHRIHCYKQHTMKEHKQATVEAGSLTVVEYRNHIISTIECFRISPENLW